MNTDAVAVAAPDRLARRSLLRRPALVAQDELIGRQANGLADGIRREAFRERFGHGPRGLLRRGLEDRLAALLNPGAAGRACAGFAAGQPMLIRQLHQHGLAAAVAAVLLVLDAVVDRLPQQGMRMLLAHDG